MYGCSTSPEKNDVEAVVAAAVDGKVPTSEEDKNKWKSVADMKEDEFFESAKDEIEKSFADRKAYTKMQRNTRVLKDTLWEEAEENKDAMIKKAAEGLREIISDMRIPITDYSCSDAFDEIKELKRDIGPRELEI